MQIVYLCCKFNLYSFVLKLGMVERMNRSIEDVMKKLLQNQADLEDMLPLVLFSVRASRHSSTGILLFRLMFQCDPIHLFELKHDGDETVNVCVSELRADEMFEKMERLRIEYSSIDSENRRETENRAMKKNKQSQERMSKYYNL